MQMRPDIEQFYTELYWMCEHGDSRAIEAKLIPVIDASQKLERIRAAFEHARDQAIRSDVKSNPADFFNAVERILAEP